MPLPGTPFARWQASSSAVAIGAAVVTVPDSSTSGSYPGTTVGSPTLRSGYLGQPAYHTDGAASYLKASAALAAALSGPGTNSANSAGWTVAVVFRPDASSPGGSVWAATNTSVVGTLERVTHAAGAAPAGTLIVGNTTGRSTATSTVVTSTTVPSVIILSSTQSTGTQVAALYHNGAKYAGVASGNAQVAAINQLLVGAGYTPAVTTGNPTTFVGGEYYDFIVWNSVLSDSDSLSAAAFLLNTYVPQTLTGVAARKPRTSTGSLRETYIANGAASRKPRRVSGVLRQTYVANGTPVRKPRTATGSGVLRVGLAGAPVRKGRTAAGAAILRLAIKGAAVRKVRTAASVVALQYAVNGAPARKPRSVTSSFKLSLAMSGAVARKPRTTSGVAHSFLKITGTVARKPRTSIGTARLFLAGHGAANRSPRTAAANLSLTYRINGAVARAPRSVTGTLTLFTLFQTTVQRHVAYGLGIAASKLGSFHTVYRPTAAMNPLQQAPLRIQLANFDGDPSFGLKRPQAWSKPIVYGMLDTTDVQVGDYLVGTDTVFVARFEPMLPPECVICSRTVSVFSSASAPPVGLDVVYGGRTDASDVMVASGWPISMVTKTRGDNVPTKLPGDVRAAYYECLIPAIPGVTLRPTMRLTDENGDNYEIVTVETSSFGNRLLVSLATN